MVTERQPVKVVVSSLTSTMTVTQEQVLARNVGRQLSDLGQAVRSEPVRFRESC